MTSWLQIRKFIVTLGIVAAISIVPILNMSSNVLAQSQQPTDKQIRKLLEVSDTYAQMQKIIPQIHDTVWKLIIGRVGNIPDDLKKNLSKEMLNVMKESAPLLIEVTIPIYKKHLTADEVAAWIDFYSTPLGQSVSRKAAGIFKEAMQAGAHLGQMMSRRAAEIAVKRLREKGYKI